MMRTQILAAIAVLAALTLTGCSDVVDGSGSEAAPSSTGGFPSDSTGPTGPTPTDTPTTSGPTTGTTGSGPAPKFTCPDVTYSSAEMTFNCISNAMTVRTEGKIFPITMAQKVEATGWQMEMGAELYEGSATSFPAISGDVRGDLLDSGAYGTSPTYDLDTVNYSTISGKPAYITIDTVILNPAWAATRKTAVKIEKRWLVIIELAPGRYTLWFASIPDIAKQFWAQVPTSIGSIKINA